MECPLDGSSVTWDDDLGYYVCDTCREILHEDDLVKHATHETWAAYLLSDSTDTDPWDAPLSRLDPRKECC